MACPELEVINVPAGDPFRIFSHGYPFHTVRWHFHPEIEIHLVTATSGRFFVGDYSAGFTPGNLVMTGPNLPHNWLSDVSPGTTIEQRCIVLQFSTDFAESCASVFPSLGLAELMDASRRGLEFDPATSAAVEPLMRAMLAGDRLSRPGLLLQVLECLVRGQDRRMLASVGYRPKPMLYMAHPLNHVLEHIANCLTGDLDEVELARLSGYTASAFSRAFHRHTGMTFTSYVTGMRVNLACKLLMTSDHHVTDICFEAGFNNVSNFNRQFRARTQTTPRTFRLRHRQNATSVGGQARAGDSVNG